MNSWGSPFNRCSSRAHWRVLSAFYPHRCLVTVLSQVHCNGVEPAYGSGFTLEKGIENFNSNSPVALEESQTNEGLTAAKILQTQSFSSMQERPSSQKG